MPTYQDEFTALKYLDFLNSYNGKLQQKYLFDAISRSLPNNKDAKILDAGCGPGWLGGELKKHFADVAGCDSSEFFIKFAKAHHQGIDFKTAALDKPLPYEKNYFDIVILNMVGPDLEKLGAAFKNLSSVMKHGTKLLMTIPNPKYTYPAAEWKRSAADVLLRRKPKLKIKNPPLSGEKIQREFGKDVKIESYYYTQADYVSAASAAGFKLLDVGEIRSEHDSPNFDLMYQLHRYPLLLLLEFEKVGQ